MVFKLVMKVKVDNFPLFLISAMFPWQWIANSIGVGPMTFLGNGSLIKKVNFPRNLLCLVVVLQDMIHYLISIPIIVLLLYLYQKTPGWSWVIGIPLFSIIQLAMSYSLNLIIATTNLFFRDIEKLVQIIMTFLFFFTPVVYKASMVPEKYKVFLYLNPTAHLIMGWRDLFINNTINWEFTGVALIWSSILLFIAQYSYNKLQWRFAEII